MNHFVPDFEMDENDSIPTSTGFSRPNNKSSFMQEDDLMELLWQNGQVVLHSQNQRNSNTTMKKSSLSKFPILESTAKNSSNQLPSASASTTVTTDEPPYQLFMQEDEMASWLHYPLDEDAPFHDLLYPAPTANKVPRDDNNRRSPVRPPIRATELAAAEPSSSFHHFIRHSRPPNDQAESRPSVSDKAVKESTVVDSSITPSVRLAPSNGFDTAAEQDNNTMTSSSGGSGGSAEPLTKPPPSNDDRKRKARDAHDDHDEDAKCEASDTKKQARGSASARRSRAAEVHNLSERRRRDRINEKMKALQELIPGCNKSDKASMLDEAIEYLKSLQLQVQMMSMGCSMVPMMFPGVQPYMSPMGMGMGMDMNMHRPMMPFPQVLAAQSMHRPSTTPPHLAPRLPMQPAYNLPSGSSPNVMVMRPNQADPSLVPIAIRPPNPMQVPFNDSYQCYLGHYNMQAPPIAIGSGHCTGKYHQGSSESR